MVFAEFEEKQYESAFNIELSSSGLVFASGQVLEKLTGYDAAGDPGANHALWRIMGVPRPQGIRLVPTHWTPASRREQPPANKLPSHPVSFIAQFKRPEYLQGSAASQYAFWRQPYYRFSRVANQHSRLRKLEAQLAGIASVTYAAPAFHRVAELEEAQLKGQIVNSTGFVSPTRLGRHRVWTYIAPGMVGRGNPDGEEITFAVFEALFTTPDSANTQAIAIRQGVSDHLSALAEASRAAYGVRSRLVDSWIANVRQVADVSPEILESLRDYAIVQSLVHYLGASWWLMDGDEFSPIRQ